MSRRSGVGAAVGLRELKPNKHSISFPPPSPPASPQTTVVGKIVALTPKVRRGAGDVPDEPYFECDIEPVEGGRGGE